MKSLPSVLVLALSLGIFSAFAQDDPTDPGDPGLPPTPDLQVASMETEPGWLHASVSDRDFLPVLKAQLQEIGEKAGAGVYIKRLLPGVNYAVVQVVNVRPDVATDLGQPVESDEIILPRLPGSPHGIELIRGAIADLPYVKGCLLNPIDNPGPRPWDGISEAGDVHMNIPEVMPGELVVAVNGMAMPVLTVHAELSVVPEEWRGVVPVNVTLTGPLRSEDGVQTRHTRAYISRGGGEVRALFLARPGVYGVVVTVDPENILPETDETNNSMDGKAEVPGVMMRLAVGNVMTIDESQSTVHGRMAIANFSEEPVVFGYGEVVMAVDGQPVEVNFYPGGPVILAAPDGDEEVGAAAVVPQVEPGRSDAWPFMFSAALAEGEHELVASIESVPLKAATLFQVKLPLPPYNLWPSRLGSRVTDVVVDPRPADPNVRQWLVNEVWSCFAEGIAPNYVRIYPQTDLAEPTPDGDTNTATAGVREDFGTGTIPEKQPDLVVVLDFSGCLEPVATERVVKQLQNQWMVTDAWILPDIYLDETARAGATNDMTSVSPTDLAVMPSIFRQVHIGIKLDRAIEPQLYTKIVAPVVLDVRPDYRPEPTPVPLSGAGDSENRITAGGCYWPYPARTLSPIAVRITGLMPVKEDMTRATTVSEGENEQLNVHIPARLNDKVPAVGYARRNDTVAAYKVEVDPDNKVPEYNENDNDVILANGATPEAVFHAHAKIEELVDSDGNEHAAVIVVGELHNAGDVALTLTFRSSLQMDFAWGNLYRWSDDKAFAQVITEVTVEPGEIRRWQLRAPLRDVWRRVINNLPGDRTRYDDIRIPPMVLEVELVGTDYRDLAPVVLPAGHEEIDANGNLIPDFQEEGAAVGANDGLSEEDGTGGGRARLAAAMRRDSDQDGWSDVLEFIEGSDSENPEEAPIGRVYTLRLEEGWNLVSLPVEPEIADVSALLGGLVEGAVYEYVESDDGLPGDYVKVDKISPHVAYWMYAPTAVEVPVAGVPHHPGRVVIRAGGADTGAGGPLLLPESALQKCQVFRWSAKAQDYVEVPDGRLDEGQGYWISAPEDIEIDL